jgi:hypothetical protein
VVELADIPTDQDGRQSKSLTHGQVEDVLTNTATDWLYAYIVLGQRYDGHGVGLPAPAAAGDPDRRHSDEPAVRRGP